MKKLLQQRGSGGITSFFGVDAEDLAIKKFHREADGKDKSGTREAERVCLKPSRISPYIGKLPGGGPIENRTVTVVFDSAEDLDLFRKFFKVNEYQGLNVGTRGGNLIPLFLFLDALDRGVLSVDKENHKLEVVLDDGERIQI